MNKDIGEGRSPRGKDPGLAGRSHLLARFADGPLGSLLLLLGLLLQLLLLV